MSAKPWPGAGVVVVSSVTGKRYAYDSLRQALEHTLWLRLLSFLMRFVKAYDQTIDELVD